MKLLITGGAGFIGSNFIRHILKKYKNYKVTNLDKLTYAGNLENLRDVEKKYGQQATGDRRRYTFIKGDICEAQTVNRAAKNVDCIINFAAETHVDRSIIEAGSFVMTDVYGTHNLLEAVKKHKISRYVQISCYDEKTRAFTYNGLREYRDIKAGDLVLTLNIKTNKVEWKPVEKVIVQDYNGKMVKMATDTVDFLVTPNHRMLFQMGKSKKLVYKTAENAAKEAINRIPKHYRWEGKTPNIIKDNKGLKDFMYILGIFIGDGFISYQERKKISKTGLLREEFLKKARDKQCRFKSIGNIGKQEFNISKSWRIFFDIPEDDPCRKRCEQSLEHLGIRWHKHKGKAGEHIYFGSKKYFEIFRECGAGAKNKKIPTWAMESPPELLHSLLEGLLDSDGSGDYIYFTSSLQLAHQVLILCAKLGLNSILKTRFTKSKIENREISGLSYYVLIGRREWRGVRREIIREEIYNGKIWCLKIKDNKNFLIERNGKVAFCGNTDEVYGSIEKGSFSEESPLKPNSPYAASKAGGDLLCRSYFVTYKLPVIITRASNNFGPFQYPEKIIPLFVTNAIENKPLPLYGDGKNIRDWLYVLDHVKAIDVVLHRGKVGEVYNIGGENEIANIALTKLVLKILNKPLSLIKPVKDRLGHDRRYSLNCDKLKKLDWKPSKNFEALLEKTVAWYIENENWWKKLKDKSFRQYYRKQYKT